MSGVNAKPVRPVRFPLQLLAGESIRGYVGRVAEHNTYEKPSQLLGAIGADLNSLLSGDVDARALSALYDTEFAGLDYAIPRYVGDGSAITAFGVSHPRTAIRKSACPVSPEGLRRSLHHRFAWSLRQFSFCSEDFSLLLFQCPVEGCGLPLHWWNGPVHLCEACGLDFRTVKTPKIHREHQAYLGVAGSLVSFDGEVRKQAIGRLPKFLGHLAPSDVFQVVLTVGRALLQAGHPLARTNRPPRDYPVAMLAGMRLMLDHDLRKIGLGSCTTKAPPPYVARTRENLRQGVLLAPASIQAALDGVREECLLLRSPRPRQDDFNLTSAAQLLGIDRKVAKQLMDQGLLRGRVVGGGPERVLSVVDEGSLAELMAQADARISLAQLAQRYGIKSSWLLDMEALGLIERAESPFIEIVYKGVQFRKSSAAAYLDRIDKGIIRTNPDDPERVSLGAVFSLLGPGPKPWLQAIMAPRLLPDGLGSHEPSGISCSALNVSRRCALMLRSGSFSFPPARFFLSNDIPMLGGQEHLNCHPRDIADLIKVGALMRSGQGLCIQSVEKCGRTLISTGELAGRAQLPALEVADAARQRGLKRPYQGVGFWDREEAEAAFDLSPIPPHRASP